MVWSAGWLTASCSGMGSDRPARSTSAAAGVSYQFFENTYHKLDSAYIKTGRVAMLYINYPLPGHPQAFAAAILDVAAS